MMKWFKVYKRQKSLFFGLSLLLLGSGLATSYAITKKRVATIGASVVVGAGAPEQLRIAHDPPPGVIRDLIIQGAASSVVDPRRIDPGGFPGFIIPIASSNQPLVQPALTEGDVQVDAFFRVLEAGQTSPPAFLPLGVVRGFDPLPFAFKLEADPDAVNQSIQYKFRVRKFLVDGSTQTAWFPPGVTDPQDDIAVTVGLNAGRAIAVIGPAGGTVKINQGNPNVGTPSFVVPAGTFDRATTVTFNRFSPRGLAAAPSLGATPSLPVLSNEPEAVYRLVIDGTIQGNKVMKMSVLFDDFDFFNGGRNGQLDVSGNTINSASLIFWDGFKWRLIGGKVDRTTNLLTANVSQDGIYAIVSIASISPEERRPARKIITPNGDGVNDTALFTLGGVAETVKIEIFDTTGHRIRSLFSSNQLEWDGRDDSGKIVESGVYIYQYKLQGKRVSGLIAVAK